MKDRVALLPQPREIRWERGTFALPEKTVIGIQNGTFYPLLADILEQLGSVEIRVCSPSEDDAITCRYDQALPEQGYCLEITRDGIRLAASDTAGARYGVQTLLQILRQSDHNKLPSVWIRDYPAFPERALYYDIARGRVPKLDRLKQQIKTLSHYKYNQIQHYVEHTFAFSRHPRIGRNCSPLKPADILELDQYAQSFDVEMIPSLASFGHMSPILTIPEYHHLAEDYGEGKYRIEPEPYPPHGWTLSPANPATYSFLEELYSEFLPLFSSSRFNCCCDETWDLGCGQSHDLCQQKGRGEVYLEHLLRLHRLAADQGKSIMFWGDIIRHHPDLIHRLPDDVVALDWNYHPEHKFDSIQDFKQAPGPFYACSGTWSWGSLFPQLFASRWNIAGFAAAASQAGATGYMLTDWGDGGHYNFMENSWYGYLFAAEQAWNPEADQASFGDRFCRVFLGIDDPSLVQAIERLGALAHPIWRNIYFATLDDPLFGSARQLTLYDRHPQKRVMTLDAACGNAVVEELQDIRAAIKPYLNRKQCDPLGVLPYWIFATDALTHAARKLAIFGAGGSPNVSAIRRLHRDMDKLQARFEYLWRERNEPSEIRITMGYYRQALKSLDRRIARRRRS